MPLNDYLQYFYDRYSKNFDANGLMFKAPSYGVDEFSEPDSGRTILSLNLYYKYRALRGDETSRDKLRNAILAAAEEISGRPENTLSFSDAFAGMATVKLLNDIPFLLNKNEESLIYASILDRLEQIILAPDTSNRAALGAVYSQLVVNDLKDKNLITPERTAYLNRLIYQKIKRILLNKDVTPLGWYKEGKPERFNPHYHMITATACLAYYEATGDIEFYVLAKKMASNLRTVSFQNGMVEAMIGERPVGLGAQFYLGAGLLNYYFNYPDYGTYFNYALDNKFFSDKNFPHRLEYHYTVFNHEPDYHDDISISNLGELMLSIPKFRQMSINFNDQLNNIPQISSGEGIAVINNGREIIFNQKKYSQVTGDATRIELLPNIAQVN